MIIDLHSHTLYSKDSLSDPFELVKTAKKIGLQGLAITDHNTIDGYEKVRNEKELFIICGEEINTDKGEIIALFLNERIKPGKIEEVLDSIKEQDAFCFIPHPFDQFRKKRMDPVNIEDKILKRINGIEVYNSRSVNWKEDSKKALEFAEKKKKTMVAGSDAHFLSEIGNSFTILPECSELEEARKKLFSGETKVNGKQSSIFYHAGTKIIKFMNRSGKQDNKNQ